MIGDSSVRGALESWYGVVRGARFVLGMDDVADDSEAVAVCMERGGLERNEPAPSHAPAGSTKSKSARQTNTARSIAFDYSVLTVPNYGREMLRSWTFLSAASPCA